MEKTLVVIKPDAFARGQVGLTLTAFEQHNGLKLDILYSNKMTREYAEKFYIEHYGKHFYDRLINFMVSGPVLFVVVDGKNAIKECRTIIKSIRETEADPQHPEKNMVHGSDSVKSAEREIRLVYEMLADRVYSIQE